MYLDDVGAFVAYDQLFMCTQIGILCDVVIFCTCDWDAEDCPITYVEDCWDEDEKMDCMVDDELCNWEEADPGGGGIQWGLNSYHCANEFCGEY